MPLPIGHAAIGVTTHYLNTKKGAGGSSLILLGYVTILANLPDLDIIAGLLLTGNGNAFHRGPSHSILFALVAALAATWASRTWRFLPDIPLRTCLMIILSHLLTDFFCTSGPVSFFWPFAVHWCSDTASLSEIVNSVLFQAFQDAALIASCAGLICMHRFLSPRKQRLRLLFSRVLAACHPAGTGLLWPGSIRHSFSCPAKIRDGVDTP